MAELTPFAWLERLSSRLDHRWYTRLGAYDAYFEGDHKLGFATRRFQEAFGPLLAAIADNWMPLVVESSVERLKVQGFRFGSATSADDDAWAIWQANDLDAESDMGHTEAVKLEESYWLVAPPRTRNDPPTVTVEHPSQVIVACDPADRRRRLAALKKWIGEDGFLYANVYLPTRIQLYRSQKKPQQGIRVDWQPIGGGPNPLGEVPVIPIRNAPAMLAGGVSDLKVAMPIQDAVNKLLSDMLIGSEYQAYPQRVAMGVEPPKNPETGQPDRAAILQSAQNQLWFLPGANAKVAEFSAADLNNYVGARQHLIRGLTAKTRTPPHYVLGEIVNASGDALKAAETGLVAKVRKKMPAFEQAHEAMMRLSFKAIGDTERAGVTDAEVIWRDPESRSQAELADSLVKLSALGVPTEVLWELYGFSPTQINRMKTIKATEDILGTAQPEPDSPEGGAAEQPPGLSEAA